MTEIERLRSEFSCQRDPDKSSQLYAAMQALEWAKNPDNAAAPVWMVHAARHSLLRRTLWQGEKIVRLDVVVHGFQVFVSVVRCNHNVNNVPLLADVERVLAAFDPDNGIILR